MDAIGTLLDRYGLPDLVAGQPEGSFVDPDLAALYESLMTEAAASTEAALAVGATIEEVDIRDLRTMRASIDNADILNVYDNLERGSRNHLRSFYGTLIGVGGAYAPKYLTQADFDAIVTSEMETGGGGPNW